MKYHPYVVNKADRAVTTPDQIVLLSPIESRLLELLFRFVGVTVYRDTLERHAWGYNHEATSRTLDAHISRLRKKLALDGTYGLHLRGVNRKGYRVERV